MLKKATKIKKEAVLRFRCTEEDRKIIEEASELDERKVSDYIRYHIVDHSKIILSKYKYGITSINAFFDMPEHLKKMFKKYLVFIKNAPKMEEYFNELINEESKEKYKEDKEFEALKEEFYVQEDSMFNDLGYLEHCLEENERKRKNIEEQIARLKQNDTEQ